MNLNHNLDSNILNKSQQIYNIINNETFGDSNFFKKDFSDLTLGKYLQLYSIANNNMTLIDCLINSGIEKSSEYLNLAAYWCNINNFIWLHKKGLANGGCKNKLQYLIKTGYPFEITYQLCELAYNNNHTKLIGYLTSNNFDNKIDNRFIIRSIIDKNYEMFNSLYKNYLYIKNYVFTGKNSKLYNDRLTEYIW